MIRAIREWVTRSWGEWFAESPGELHTALLAGGPAHRERVSIMVFQNAERTPRVFLKVGLSAIERDYVAGEHSAVRELSHEHQTRDLVPTALAMTEADRWLGAAYVAIHGRRLVVPQLLKRVGPIGRRDLSKFWTGTARSALRLAESHGTASARDERALGEVVETFARSFDLPERANRELEAFQARIERERIRWTPSWQHGDVAVGNVLVDKGHLRLVDWEAARPDYEPWFDLATAPVAAVILAARQSGIPVSEAAMSVLSEDRWVGSTIATTLRESWNWGFPIAWGVALTAMRMANRRHAEHRTMPSGYVELAAVLLCDRDLRSRVGWVAA